MESSEYESSDNKTNCSIVTQADISAEFEQCGVQGRIEVHRTVINTGAWPSAASVAAAGTGPSCSK
jgi:hypothetical protein